LPDFLTPESGFGREWGTSPIAGEIDPLRGERRDEDRKRLSDAILGNAPIEWAGREDGSGVQAREDGTLRVGHSHEIIDDLVTALEHGHDFFVHLNLPNEGAIEGVGDEHNVEIPVTLRGGAIERPRIRYSDDKLTAEVERVAREQTLIARGAVEGDRSALVDALAMDALVSSRDIAERLVKEMTMFQREYIDPALVR
jgi:alpha-galactosidase/6-phospho-beta-glucosidase family protein